MLYIINGSNYFEKESSITSIINTLGETYEVKHFNISSTTKTDVANNMLEELLIGISVDGLFSSEYCGIVSLPNKPKKKSNSKKKNNNNLFLDLVELANTYCDKSYKHLVLYLPTLLSATEKKEVSKICTNINVEFIDLKYISNYKEIYTFCSNMLEELNINFVSNEDKDSFISTICSYSECVTNKNGDLDELTVFTKPSEIIYNQQLLYSSMVSLSLWSKDSTSPITFEDCKRILLSSQPKQYIYSSIENIMRCSSKKELATIINETFDSLTKNEIFSLLTTLKLCFWDYVSFTNGSSQTRNCRLITNSNLTFKDPLTLYHKIYKLREDVTLHTSSYKTDLILYLWEHSEDKQ